MKRMSRREFGRLAAVGAVGVPLARMGAHELAPAQSSSPQTAPKPTLTAEQEKKLQEEVAKRAEDLGPLRDHTLPYSLEPAFLFRARSAPRRHPVKG